MANLTAIENEGLTYIDGFLTSNDSTTPTTKINISPGRCASFSTSLPNSSFDLSSSNVLSFDNVSKGVNGLDTGTIATSKTYAVYVIGSQSNREPIACLYSLSLTEPLMPIGKNGSLYDLRRLVSFVSTNSGATTFISSRVVGAGAQRSITYDSPISVLTGGSSTSSANVNLVFAPPIENLKVTLAVSYVPVNAGSFTSIGRFGLSSQISLSGPLAASKIHAQYTLLSGLNSNSPTVNYVNIEPGASTDIKLMSYEFTVPGARGFNG